MTHPSCLSASLGRTLDSDQIERSHHSGDPRSPVPTHARPTDENFFNHSPANNISADDGTLYAKPDPGTRHHGCTLGPFEGMPVKAAARPLLDNRIYNGNGYTRSLPTSAGIGAEVRGDRKLKMIRTNLTYRAE